MEWTNLDNSSEWVFTTPIQDLEQLVDDISYDSMILDIGCGYGRMLKYLADNGYKNLYGIDISEKLLQRAHKECPIAHLLLGDCNDIDILFKKKFDVIIVLGVIEYITSDKKQIELLAKTKKLLSPNGILIIESFTFDLHNLKQYIKGIFQFRHLGLFKNSKGFICHHHFPDTIVRRCSTIFPKVTSQKLDFVSWTNNIINGIRIIAHNNYEH